MKSDNARPLSPHFQVYRWPLAMALSILHRVSGLALSVGAVLLVWWLLAAAEGPAAHERMQHFLGSWIGLLLLFGWSVALFYHLCAGVRHLWWDTGRGLDLPSVYRGNWAVITGTIALTLSVRIDLPHGFEFHIAEIGSATTRASGTVDLPDLVNTYGQFAHLHLSNNGVVD